MISEEIIQKAQTLAMKEREGNIGPLFELANQKGQYLAERYDVDKSIVMLGTLFMDLKIKEAIKQGRLKDHVQMSADSAKQFMDEHSIDPKTSDIVLNCVLAHHKEVPFKSREAEIVMNADCYKFLHPRGILLYFKIMIDRIGDMEKAIEGVVMKMDEKFALLTLEIPKKELTPYYHQFKEIFRSAAE